MNNGLPVIKISFYKSMYTYIIESYYETHSFLFALCSGIPRVEPLSSVS